MRTTRGLDRVAAVAAVAVLAGLAGWVTFGSLQQDLAAYVTAARARGAGLDPYLNHLATPGAPWDGVAVYRHSRFLYPPLLADVFRPLAALPYAWAKGLFTIASVAGLGLGLWLAGDGDGGSDETRARTMLGAPPPRLGFVLLAAAVWPSVFVALERGQIDLLLLPLLALAWRRRDRPVVAGVALAVVALAKPFVLVAWPILMCARRWRLVGAAAGSLAALLALGAIVSGPALSRAYLTEVLPRAILYGEGGPEAWLLPDESLARAGDALALGTARLDPGGRSFPTEIGGFRRNASLVRLLAGDEAPARGLGAILLVVLAAVLGRAAIRRPDDPGWFWGAVLAGVVTAPVAWAMSLSLGLPLLFGAATDRASPRRPAGAAVVLAYGAALMGPFVPAAWCVAGLAGVAAGALSTKAPFAQAPSTEAPRAPR